MIRRSPIAVDKYVLDFNANEVSTQIIKVTTEIKGRDVLGEIIHNLPPCFDIDPPAGRMAVPSEVRVTYKSTMYPLEFDYDNLEFTIAERFRNEEDLDAKHLIKINLLGAPSRPIRKARNMTSDNTEPSCDICTLKFSEDDMNRIPLVLSCGHTLCRGCCQTLKDRSFNRTVSCPTDRSVTRGDVSKFIRNFCLINYLRETTQKPPVFCENPFVPCFENPNHEAAFYCSTCDVDFCESCFQTVHSHKILANHKVVPIADKPFKPTMCVNHPTKYVRYLCTNENCVYQPKLFCDDCMPDHRCPYTTDYFDRISENRGRVVKISNFIKQVDTNVMPKRKKVVMDCKASFSEDDRTIQMCYEKIEAHFERLKDTAIARFGCFLENAKDTAQRELNRIEKNAGEISKLRKDVDKFLNRREGFLDIEAMVDKEYEVRKKMAVFQRDMPKFSDYDFKPAMTEFPQKFPQPENDASRKRPAFDPNEIISIDD
ncbi:hypothetical protein GCK72_023588 [Caenorhabditis remanei]|uniref:RING-type domain-containing protein n=1 Tax=Caenorhabditis remanei TaxID=31234 RepID=A0A6A5FWV5_CAERE|nr:hypothetical protein GCK72_023588 [Caenorhabditis remanei]KAF1747128.1 hypothetical protein GCK72_023588 [Caenorhabditis remanei]